MGRFQYLGVMVALAFAAALAVACGTCPTRVAQQSSLSPPIPAPTPAAQLGIRGADPGDGRGRLVMLVVFDQLGADTLARHLPHLDPDGAIRSGIAQGAFFPRARYPQAVTLTAPGHALLATGAAPAQSGITANEMRIADGDSSSRMSTSVQDGAYPVLGMAHGGGVAPTLLAAPTVADALRARYGDATRIVSMSIKDRGAVLPGGKKPNAALWYEAELGRFTSSAYYGPEPPAWLTAFEAEYPLQDLLVPWTVPDAEQLAARLGADAAEGEGTYGGFGSAFPHDPNATRVPAAALRMMPALSERLIALAERAVLAEGLGTRGVPDLLSLSISGTDYAGHVFGPDSWEYFDHLRRADRALGALIRRLQARGPLSVLITSDHGVARLPERDGRLRRLASASLSAAIEEVLDAEFGALSWVQHFGSPYLYLTPAALAHPRLAEARVRLCEVLQRQPGIAHVVDLAAMESGPCSLAQLPESVRKATGLSLFPGRVGDFYVIPQQGLFLDEVPGGAGTTHGSPWPYDRTVPVVAFGVDIIHVQHDGEVDMRQVAPTLAWLLGVPAPSAASAAPLPVR